LAGLLFLTGRAVWALWTRRWVGATVRVLALPVCLILGVASLLVGEMAGRWVGQATELVVGASPLPKKEVLAWQILGREAAAQLPAEELPEAWTDKRWKFDGLEFVWKRGGRWEVHFQFSRRGADFASVTLRFRQTDGGGWREHGYAGSGDPALIQAARAVLGSYLREALSSSELPARPLTEERLGFFREAGEELAAGFAEASPLDSEDLLWRLEEMGFADKHMGQGRAPVQMLFRATLPDSSDSVWAETYWTWSGGRLHLVDSNASISRGNHSRGELTDHARLQSFLGDWLRREESKYFAAPRDSRGWQDCTADLPDGWRLIYWQKSAHVFLAEYYMAAEFVSPDGRRMRFELPLNTGGRTVLNVFRGRTAAGAEAILLSSRHFAAAWELPECRWIDAEEVIDPEFLGAFLQVTTPLRWAALADPEAAELLEQAGQRGYPFVGQPRATKFDR
jgi:hypothetical protein